LLPWRFAGSLGAGTRGSEMKISSVWRVFAAAVSMLVAMPALASERPGFATYNSAADSFDRLAAVALGKGAPPRSSDPEVASLIRTLSSGDAIFEDRKFNAEDLEQLGAILNRALGIVGIYAEFGASATASENEINTLSDRNMIAYQNEMTPLLAFVLETTSVIARAFDDNMDPATFTPDQRSGALQMRQGVSQMAPAFVEMGTMPGVTPENRLIFATTLSRNASDIAGALTLTQRKALGLRIRAARARAGPQAQREFDVLLTALAATSCEGLCAL
jgi:hypothetical protein